MAHPNEERLRELYAIFAKGDLDGFLAGCADDVTFTVPGRTPASGEFTKADFIQWIGAVLATAEGTFQEHVLDVWANDDHGALQLLHEFDRGGIHRSYQTIHAVEFRNGQITRWEERPGSLAEFETAWGIKGQPDADVLIRRIFDTFNSKDLDAIDELFTEDYVDHGPMGDLVGRDGLKAMMGQWLAAVPDAHTSVEHLTVDGDMAAWVVRTTGTHTGDSLGFPATGMKFETISANIGRIRDGRAAEHWSEQGMFPMLVQLGVIPS
jgi:ketosteroid isomerase-like protein